MYARVFRALTDTSADAGDRTRCSISSQSIVAQGVPIIVTDVHGPCRPSSANLPLDGASDERRSCARYVRELDRQNPPVVDRSSGRCTTATRRS